MKKLLFLVALFMLLGIGYAQQICNQEVAKEIDTEMPTTQGNRALWDLAFWFNATTNQDSGVATDGIHFYTGTSNGNFYRYNMDGSNPEVFTISGVNKVSDFTYDGEYFYTVDWTTPFINKLDLANQVRIAGIPIDYQNYGFWYPPTAIAYDPGLDEGNGGFWISDYFNLVAVSMTGVALIPTNATILGWESLAGIAYDPYTDPLNPCLWFFLQGDGGGGSIFKQFDIATMSYTGVTHSCHPDNPNNVSYTVAQAAFAYNNGEGKFLIAASTRTSSPFTVLVYELCDVALPAAPGPVTDLTVTPGASGALNAVIEWTNPTLTEEEGILTQLSAIKIFGNDVLVHTVTNPTIGGSETYSVLVGAAGEYIYKLVAENSAGESMPAIEVVWIGHDVPAAPETVTLVKNGTNAEVSWTAVTTGLHNGYFTTEEIMYDVYRYPNAVPVATNLTTLTFSESISQLQGYYFYRVVAKNNVGEGGFTNSNTGVFCDVQSLPYFEGFENNGTNFPMCWEQEFVAMATEWEVVKDVNAIPTIDGQYMAEIRTHFVNTEITKLITPPLDLSGTGNYVLSFWSAPRAATEPFDVLKTYYKTSATGEWILLDEYTPQFYGWDDMLQNWKKRTLMLPDGTDDYFIAFEGSVAHIGLWIDAISVFDARIVTGIVTDGDVPIAGAKVEVEGTEHVVYTNESGYYEILDIAVGNYNFNVTKLGYYDKTEQVAISGSITIKDFVLTPIPTYTVSGTITGSDAPNGIAEVNVTLSGYNTYTTTTNATGDYSLTNVYGGNTYNIEAYKSGYVRYNSQVNIVSSNVTRDISLMENASPVLHPTVVDKGSYAEISWGQPVHGTSEIFRFDSGIADGQLGYTGSPAPNGVMGTCHRVNASIEKIQWFLTNEATEPATYVSVFIFDLDAEGKPTKNVIYSNPMVPTTVMQWCEYVFPTPVVAPNGFYMALSRPVGSYLSLGFSHPTEEWPFQPNTHYYLLDYTTLLNYLVITEHNYNCNFMLRAEGYSLGKAVQFGYPLATSATPVMENTDREPLFITSEPFVTEEPAVTVHNDPKSLLNYKVYRLEDGQQNDETVWTTLAENVSELSYNDNEWGSLGEAGWRWAVKAEYTDGNLSVPRFTNMLIIGMEYSVTIYLTTNSGDPATGAFVTLTNQDGNPDHVYKLTSTGAAVNFTKVWKGTYNISITLRGFQPYTATNIVIDATASHNAELIEIRKPVFDLAATQVDNNVEISWRDPNTPNIFRHDSGINDQQIGFQGGTANGVIGSVHVVSAELTGISWYLTDNAVQPAVNIFIFGINEAGQPDRNKLIYSVQNIPNTPQKWCYYDFPTPIAVPNGFFMGLSPTNGGFLSLGTDAPNSEYPFKGNTHFYSSSYTQFDFAPFESSEILRNAMIRAEGFLNNKTSHGGFTIYRFIAGQPETQWNMLSNNVIEPAYTDTDWSTLSTGSYQWAVKSNYTSGQSEAVLSNILIKDVGVNEIAFANIQLYPNPFTNEIYISQPDLVKSVQITDIVGQQIKNVTFNGKSISGETLSNGIYFVTIESFTGEKLIHKMVKK